MTTLHVATNRREEILDVTGLVQDALRSLGAQEGVALVSVPHCTCALYLNENESGLVQDTLELVRHLGAQRRWQHDRIDDNAAAHLAATLVGGTVLVPVHQGRLALGTWQRIMLLELDGPRRRSLIVALLAEKAG